MPKRPPRKPDRPIGAAIFPKTGKVRLEIEHLPTEQKPLEMTIGEKFVGAMSRFRHVVLTDLRLGIEPADLFCTNGDGLTLGIQVTEMVDAFGAKLNAHRDDYLRALKDRCANTLLMFSGCSLSILDDGTEDFFPPLNSHEGRSMLSQLASHLETLAGEINTLGVRRVRSRRWVIGEPEKEISVLCERHTHVATGTGHVIRWGRQRTFRENERIALLSDTIRNKITKCYAQPNHEFWLLVYSTDMPLAVDDPSIGLSAALLGSSPHPFDKVWFFFPYHGRNLGHIVAVWARS